MISPPPQLHLDASLQQPSNHPPSVVHRANLKFQLQAHGAPNLFSSSAFIIVTFARMSIIDPKTEAEVMCGEAIIDDKVESSQLVVDYNHHSSLLSQSPTFISNHVSLPYSAHQGTKSPQPSSYVLVVYP